MRSAGIGQAHNVVVLSWGNGGAGRAGVTDTRGMIMGMTKMAVGRRRYGHLCVPWLRGAQLHAEYVYAATRTVYAAAEHIGADQPELRRTRGAVESCSDRILCPMCAVPTGCGALPPSLKRFNVCTGCGHCKHLQPVG